MEPCRTMCFSICWLWDWFIDKFQIFPLWACVSWSLREFFNVFFDYDSNTSIDRIGLQNKKNVSSSFRLRCPSPPSSYLFESKHSFLMAFFLVALINPLCVLFYKKGGKKTFVSNRKRTKRNNLKIAHFAEWQQQFHRFQCIAWAPKNKINSMRPPQCGNCWEKLLDLFKAIIYYSSIAFREAEKRSYERTTTKKSTENPKFDLRPHTSFSSLNRWSLATIWYSMRDTFVHVFFPGVFARTCCRLDAAKAGSEAGRQVPITSANQHRLEKFLIWSISLALFISFHSILFDFIVLLRPLFVHI